MKTMRAMVCHRYGPPEVFEPAEWPVPEPRRGEVRVRVRVTAATASDTFIRGYRLPLRVRIPLRLAMGITRPRKPVQGLVFSGEIDRVGPGVKGFKPGDRVTGITGFTLGAYAEYLCIPAHASTRGCLSLFPDTLDWVTGAALPYGGLLALQALDKGGLAAGMEVCVYGASGSTGTAAVQMARAAGARVTAVCGPSHGELVRSLGADAVLDYTRQDTPPPGTVFHLVVDAVGKAKTSNLKEACRAALVPGGKYASIDGDRMLLSPERLERIIRLASAGLYKPVIGQTFRLEELSEAHRLVEKGHKTGNVMVTV